MRGVVDRAVVEQDEVLVRGAAADVEAAGGFAHGLDARQGEHGFDDVSLAEGGRDLVDDFHPHPLQADLGVAVARHGIRGDHGAGQGRDFLLHHDVERTAVPDFEGQVEVFEGVAAEIQLVVADGQGEAVESRGIGDGVGAGLVVVDGHAGHRFAAGDVAHVAADEDLAGAAGARLPDLVDLVLEGGDGILLGQVLLQAAVVGEPAPPVVEIPGGQGREDGLVVEDEQHVAVAAGRVAVFAELRERRLQEGRARGADREGGLFFRIRNIVDLGIALAAEEAHERVQPDALDFQQVLGGQAAGAEDQQQEGRDLLHRAAALRTPRQ